MAETTDPWLKSAPPLPDADLSPWSASALAGADRADLADEVAWDHAAPEETGAGDNPPAPSDPAGTPGIEEDPEPPGDGDASPFSGPPPETARGDEAAAAGDLNAPDPGTSAGFFGKLPMRGDFISRNLPRTVLRPFETWLEDVMAGCRAALGAGWQASFDAAPMWHFWIGPAVFGTACTGAMMPSADRAGRRFPAVVLLADEPDAPRCPPPPPVAPCTSWHAACAGFLRAAPGHGDIAPFEAALAALPLPVPGDAGLAALAGDPRRALWAHAGPGGLADLLADASAGDHQLAAASRSYWWTGLPGDMPGTTAPAAALIALEGLPDAGVFAFMLSGAGTARLANASGSA